MLLIVLALVWVALLAPVVVRRLRESGAERSIQSFHAEHEVLSRQDYAVAPAHRLDEPDQGSVMQPVGSRRPRLTVVQPDDTFTTLQSRSSWDEWSDDYEYDEEPPTNAATSTENHYARAYSTHPSDAEVTSAYEPPVRRRSMRAQRRIVFTRLVLCAAVFTIIAFFTGYSLLVDLAALSWFSVVVFIALALYAISQGYLSDSSLRVRLPQRRPLATVEPLYRDRGETYDPYEEDIDDEIDEPEFELIWDREPERRRALG